jgi:Transglycosylase SLT domain
VPRSDHELALERLDYTRVGDHLAVLRVLARITADVAAPPRAQLVVGSGPLRGQPFPARAYRSELRLLAGGESELLWRALFVLPLQIMERHGSGLELTAADHLPLALPTPGVRTAVPGTLTIAPVPTSLILAGGMAGHGDRLTVRQLRRRAVALATAMAVSATTTPAIALADSGVAPRAHAHETEQRIETLARFAARRARSEAASRKASRSSSKAASSARSTGPRAARDRLPGGSRLARPRRAGEGRPARGPVTHLFSSPAQDVTVKGTVVGGAPECPPPVGTPPGGIVLPATGKRAVKRPAEAATSGQRSTCTAPGTPAASGPGQGPGNTTSPPPTTKTGPRTGTGPGTGAGPGTGTGTGTGAGPGTGTGTGAGPGTGTGAPTGSGGHAEPQSHRPMPVRVPRTTSGGSAVRPAAGHSEARRAKSEGRAPRTADTAPTLVSSPPGFLGPKAWTGTVTNDPALVGALGNLSNVLQNGDRPPRFLIPIYMEAGHRFHVPWEVLAAINAVESDYGRDLSTSTAGAIGWMQFEPSTWREYGVAADGHSVPNPYDPRDAIFSAARYLAAAGAAQDISRAVYAYNHATWYVDMVLKRATAIAASTQVRRETVKRGVVSLLFATAQRRHPTIRFKGGLLSHYDRLIASANMVSAANFPYVYGGGHEQPARFTPFDCSGSVSYVVQQAGYKVPTTVSGEIPIWKFPAGPGRVTIFYNAGHTFMRIGNRYFGTSGFARSGGGAGWFDTNQLPAGYLAQFREVHVPRLGVNSFAPPKPVSAPRS